jgi:hypothetical protein
MVSKTRSAFPTSVAAFSMVTRRATAADFRFGENRQKAVSQGIDLPLAHIPSSVGSSVEVLGSDGAAQTATGHQNAGRADLFLRPRIDVPAVAQGEVAVGPQVGGKVLGHGVVLSMRRSHLKFTPESGDCQSSVLCG